MKHRILQPIKVCSNDNPWLTLTYSVVYGKVKFCNLGFYLETMTMMDCLEIIAACDLEVCLCSKQNE